MNRLSPLVARRSSPVAAPIAVAVAIAEAEFAESGKWLEDLRLFATGWIGGLIFFGTLIG